MNIFQGWQFPLLQNGWKRSLPRSFTYKSNSTREGKKKRKKNSLPGLQEMVMTSEWGFFFKESWILRACLVLLTRKFESWSINPELINVWWQFASLNSQVRAYSLLGSSDLCGEMLANRISRARGGQSLWWKMCPLLINGQQLLAARSCKKQSQLSDLYVHHLPEQGVDFVNWLSQDVQNFSTKVPP